MRALATALLVSAVAAAPAAAATPQTGFEQREGASWTTHAEELAFLNAVDEASPRMAVAEIGRTAQKRPLHLVRLGAPAPRGSGAVRHEPSVLFVCSQHGNEPAGREACLILLRDLAFSEDPAVVSLLEQTSILFVPAANPDGREANTRGNSAGTDINRDHLNLESPEARAIAAVVRDWQPDLAIDLHEYGPSIPALYDDEVLFLWPRNLNVDEQVYDLSVELAQDFIRKGAEDNGYTADEYGLYEVAGNDIHQSAGDGDEGIMRNAMGLRNALGILVETRVDADARNGPAEVLGEPAVNQRRVAAHLSVSHGALRFLRERGEAAAAATEGANERMAMDKRPVYFGGGDNAEPAAEDVVDPAPCGYSLTKTQLGAVRTTLDLLAIRLNGAAEGAFVPMAQPGEPLIPLLLDGRGTRHSVEGTPVAC
jgi:hypothetical protein